MNKYKLIHELCESRIFRNKQAPSKFSDSEQQTLFYSVLLSTIAMTMDTKTSAWAQQYASKTAAFGNFDFFRTSGTDLYVLTYLAQNENKSITRQTTRGLLRIYKGLGRGNVERSFIEQTLLRLERGLNISDTRLRNARRTIANWGTATPVARKTAITQLHRFIRIKSKLAEVLPYLLVLTKGEKGKFGKMTPLKKAAALAGAGLAGLAIGLRFDPNKKGWRVFKNSAVFDGDKMLTEDRPTQLFHIVQNLKHHPDIERVISVNYLPDGISAFIRDTQGNAYELEIRPAPFAKDHKEKRGMAEGEVIDFATAKAKKEDDKYCADCNGWGMTGPAVTGDIDDLRSDAICLTCKGTGKRNVIESSWEWRIIEDENPLAKFGVTKLSDIIEQGDVGYSDDPAYMYWLEVPNRGSSGYFSQREDAYALAREDYPYLIDDEVE